MKCCVLHGDKRANLIYAKMWFCFADAWVRYDAFVYGIGLCASVIYGVFIYHHIDICIDPYSQQNVFVWNNKWYCGREILRPQPCGAN